MLSKYNLCRCSVMLITYNLCQVQSCSVCTISVEFNHTQHIQSLSSSVMLSHAISVDVQLLHTISVQLHTISVEFSHAQYIQSVSSAVLLSTYNLCKVQSCSVLNLCTVTTCVSHTQYKQFSVNFTYIFSMYVFIQHSFTLSMYILGQCSVTLCTVYVLCTLSVNVQSRPVYVFSVSVQPCSVCTLSINIQSYSCIFSVNVQSY